MDFEEVVATSLEDLQAGRFTVVTYTVDYPRKLRSKKKRIRNKWNKKYLVRQTTYGGCTVLAENTELPEDSGVFVTQGTITGRGEC
jgi:hypothetical protein